MKILFLVLVLLSEPLSALNQNHDVAIPNPARPPLILPGNIVFIPAAPGQGGVKNTLDEMMKNCGEWIGRGKGFLAPAEPTLEEIMKFQDMLVPKVEAGIRASLLELLMRASSLSTTRGPVFLASFSELAKRTEPPAQTWARVNLCLESLGKEGLTLRGLASEAQKVWEAIQNAAIDAHIQGIQNDLKQDLERLKRQFEDLKNQAD